MTEATMKRLGTVLVFKEGVKKAEAAAALAKLAALLEPGFLDYPTKNGRTDYAATPTAVPFLLHEYEADHWRAGLVHPVTLTLTVLYSRWEDER
jgi:hypothetical protein